MNTLIHIATAVALLWLAVFLFSAEIDEPALGVAVLGVFLLYIPLTLMALADDQDTINRMRGRR